MLYFLGKKRKIAAALGALLPNPVGSVVTSVVTPASLTPVT